MMRYGFSHMVLRLLVFLFVVVNGVLCSTGTSLQKTRLHMRENFNPEAFDPTGKHKFKHQCTEGFFGKSCIQRCSKRCADGCHKTNGTCRRCPPGYFGSTCNKRCSVYCGEGLDHKTYCNISSGECSDGCKTGHWGYRCKKTCWFCNNSHCNFVDGTCMTGCRKGYFSVRCSMKCPTKCKDAVCNSMGYCTEGCLNRFAGKYCNESCSPGCLICSQDKTRCFEFQDSLIGPTCEAESCVFLTLVQQEALIKKLCALLVLCAFAGIIWINI